MIYLSSSALMVISNDGTKTAFEPEELQTRLINSCIVAGIKDFWLAEDISNAVENALSFQAENGITFSESEINSFIMKILEDTGFPNVADSFKKNNKISNETVKVTLNTIKSLFRSRFGLNEKDVMIVSEKVLKVCEILKIRETQPQLLIELGRHYKNKEIRTPEIKTFVYKNKLVSPWILTNEDIESLLLPETTHFIDNKLINLNGVSGLFPSLKIDIMLEVLAKMYQLEPIITELLLFPCYRQPADAVNEIIKSVTGELKLRNIIPKNKELPVYLRFPDIYRFSKKFLGASYPEGEKFCWDTVAAGFVENLNYHVYVKQTS